MAEFHTFIRRANDILKDNLHIRVKEVIIKVDVSYQTEQTILSEFWYESQLFSLDPLLFNTEW